MGDNYSMSAVPTRATSPSSVEFPNAMRLGLATSITMVANTSSSSTNPSTTTISTLTEALATLTLYSPSQTSSSTSNPMPISTDFTFSFPIRPKTLTTFPSPIFYRPPAKTPFDAQTPPSKACSLLSKFPPEIRSIIFELGALDIKSAPSYASIFSKVLESIPHLYPGRLTELTYSKPPILRALEPNRRLHGEALEAHYRTNFLDVNEDNYYSFKEDKYKAHLKMARNVAVSCGREFDPCHHWVCENKDNFYKFLRHPQSPLLLATGTTRLVILLYEDVSFYHTSTAALLERALEQWTNLRRIDIVCVTTHLDRLFNVVADDEIGDADEIAFKYRSFIRDVLHRMVEGRAKPRLAHVFGGTDMPEDVGDVEDDENSFGYQEHWFWEAEDKGPLWRKKDD